MLATCVRVPAGALALHVPAHVAESGQNGWGLVLPGEKGSFVDPYSTLHYLVRVVCMGV
jgi:hypothetical protein